MEIQTQALVFAQQALDQLSHGLRPSLAALIEDTHSLGQSNSTGGTHQKTRTEMIPSASCNSQKFKSAPVPINWRVSPQTVVYSPAGEYYRPVKINNSESTAYVATWMSLTNMTTSKRNQTWECPAWIHKDYQVQNHACHLRSQPCLRKSREVGWLGLRADFKDSSTILFLQRAVAMMHFHTVWCPWQPKSKCGDYTLQWVISLWSHRPIVFSVHISPQ